MCCELWRQQRDLHDISHLQVQPAVSCLLAVVEAVQYRSTLNSCTVLRRLCTFSAGLAWDMWISGIQFKTGLRERSATCANQRTLEDSFWVIVSNTLQIVRREHLRYSKPLLDSFCKDPQAYHRRGVQSSRATPLFHLPKTSIASMMLTAAKDAHAVALHCSEWLVQILEQLVEHSGQHSAKA